MRKNDKKEVVSPLDLWKNTYPIDLHGEKFLIISPFISQYPIAIRLFARIQSNFDLKAFYEQELWGIEENKTPEGGRTFASDALFKNNDKSDNATKFQTLINYVEKNTDDALDLLSLFMVKESTYQTMIKDNLKVESVIEETKQSLSLINSIPTIFALSKLVFEVNPDFFMKQMEQVTAQIQTWKAEKQAKATTQLSTKSSS